WPVAEAPPAAAGHMIEGIEASELVQAQLNGQRGGLRVGRIADESSACRAEIGLGGLGMLRVAADDDNLGAGANARRGTPPPHPRRAADDDDDFVSKHAIVHASHRRERFKSRQALSWSSAFRRRAPPKGGTPTRHASKTSPDASVPIQRRTRNMCAGIGCGGR